MKKFVVGLITNRFGIVLATLNLCYFVSRDFVRYVFAHVHGEKYVLEPITIEKCFFSNDSILVLVSVHTAGIMELMNMPALLLTWFSSKFINVAAYGSCAFTKAEFDIAFLLLFIILQWLFIGWAAKKIAQKIQ